MPRPPDDRALLDLLGDVVGVLDLEEFQRELLRGLLTTLPCKWASLNSIGPAGVSALVTPHLADEWFGRFAELAHENPLYQYWLRTHDGRAYRFRDVAERASLEATRLYREVYAPLGIRYQVAFTLPSEPDQILAVVLHREEHDFSDAERDFLDRARPFLIQAHRNAIAYSALKARSLDALDGALTGHGLTTREAEVLRLVALGGSNRDIAARLGVSDRTVQKHLERTFRKLGVSSRSAAAARAWELASA
jgi:DNA-binding NarL/FixJ family response regulator